jgi:hypothetical protein
MSSRKRRIIYNWTGWVGGNQGRRGTTTRCPVFMVNLFIIVSIFGIIPHYTLYFDIDLLIRLIHAILK